MVLVLIGAIQNISRDVEDAARVLGASWASAFLRVTLPLSAPGVLSGAGLDRLEARCDEPLPLEADGEDLGDVTEALFEAEPDALTVLG